MLNQTTSLNTRPALTTRPVSSYMSKSALLFLNAWKNAVELIEVRYFGDGTQEGFETAQCIYDLRPNIKLIGEEIHSIEVKKRKFLIFFVSMYDPHASIDLLSRCSLSLEDVTVNLTDEYQDAVQSLFNHYTQAGWW